MPRHTLAQPRMPRHTQAQPRHTQRLVHALAAGIMEHTACAVSHTACARLRTQCVLCMLVYMLHAYEEQAGARVG
jgi:hypothetical protein